MAGVTGASILLELTELVNSPQFRDAKFVADFTNVNRYAASIANALALTVAYPGLENLLNFIFAESYVDKDYIIHNGIQIPNIPLASEVLKRLVAPAFLKFIQSPGAGNNEVDEIKSPVWKIIPAALEDAYVAALNVAPGVAAKWDARVKQIRDGLAQKVSASGATTFDTKRLVTLPSSVTVTRLNNINPVVAEAVFRQNNPDNIGRVIPVSPFRYTIGVNRQLGGSNQNLHAPLYPKLIMNGGAHPFAILSGGDGEADSLVAVVQSNIDALKAQYQAITGKPIEGVIARQIQDYLTTVSTGLVSLHKELNNLRDASGYLAQNPLGPGLPLPASSDDLETLAKKGREVSEKSLRLSKQFGKLADIEKLLKELVDQVKPRPVA
jgi:hypothetical protein